jgi:uncharacterized RDD family membrane protein YckC
VSRIPAPPTAEKRLGHYAGFATRVVALAIDAGILWGVFTLAVAGLQLFIELITGAKVQATHNRPVWDVALVVWSFLYFAVQWSMSARTAGMAFMGLRVVRRDGDRFGVKTACLRTLGLALCAIIPIPAVIVFFCSRERRCLDDMIAGTAVVYSWDARAARLRWLAHRDQLAPAQPTPAQPTRAQPTPAQPTPAQPTPAQPTPAQPTPAQPAPAQPTPRT